MNTGITATTKFVFFHTRQHLNLTVVTSSNISCVHTSLVSRPEVYLKFTSDVNRSNCSVSRLLCSRGNDFSSKEPKYTSK